MITVSLLGAGNRGLDTYATIAQQEFDDVKFLCCIDVDSERLSQFQRRFGVSDESLYKSADEFFKRPRQSDLLIIATQDASHYTLAKKALDKGYDLILEKPAALNIEELLELEELSNKLGRTVIVCHVLRYHKMWQMIKNIVDEGKLGKIITISHHENIGHYHYTHSYVRGSWRKKETSGPLVLTKSSHDVDLLYYLVGSKIKRVASFGSLSYFHSGNAPQVHGERCESCAARKDCRYEGERVYTSFGGFYPLFTKNKYTKKAVIEGLRSTDYGRCIYLTDNDVVDHQSSILEFENGVSATFNLNAFTRRTHRFIKVMCEYGEIIADERTIEISTFELQPLFYGFFKHFFHLDRRSTRRIKLYKPWDISRYYGHGGADRLFVKSVFDSYRSKKESITPISQSVHSQIVSLALEEARVTGQTVFIEEFIDKNRKTLSY
jgi:predicted dehydrogenase